MAMRFDHFVVTVASIEATCAFHRAAKSFVGGASAPMLFFPIAAN
ncbi:MULTISPECIES: hypothetical protein [unclassified Lysobacter]|nr:MULTISPECIES: hypothetical protein [unclassified Lysobacter]